jgi:hypothetical protein
VNKIGKKSYFWDQFWEHSFWEWFWCPLVYGELVNAPKIKEHFESSDRLADAAA